MISVVRIREIVKELRHSVGGIEPLSCISYGGTTAVTMLKLTLLIAIKTSLKSNAIDGYLVLQLNSFRKRKSHAWMR
jgi:hypothetical protein